jgi:lipopolysaccharide/colanic/teichoic acid biosynthesis glycosyltransferase
MGTPALDVRRRAAIKRAFDLVVGGLLTVALAPVLLGVAALVRIFLGSPVLFRQRRPGLHGKLFTIYKFRTMRDALDSHGTPLPDAQRLTRFGRLLRSTSIDELPELLNVLKGDMSLVGPRPLLQEYLPYYTERERRRHSVRPGITGWAQVNGRNFRPWNERLELDVWYVDHGTLALDLRILATTFLKVLRRDGIAVDTGQVEVRLDHLRRDKNARAPCGAAHSLSRSGSG